MAIASAALFVGREQFESASALPRRRRLRSASSHIAFRAPLADHKSFKLWAHRQVQISVYKDGQLVANFLHLFVDLRRFNFDRSTRALAAHFAPVLRSSKFW